MQQNYRSNKFKNGVDYDQKSSSNTLNISKYTREFIIFLKMKLKGDQKNTSKSFTGRWSKAEHDRFMLGLDKFGRNWVQVQKIVKTRTIVQVRSHAQKVFQKMSQQDIQSMIGADDSYQESDYCDQSQQKITVQKVQKNQNQAIIIPKPRLNLIDIFFQAIESHKNLYEHQTVEQPPSSSIQFEQSSQNYQAQQRDLTNKFQGELTYTYD